MFMKKFVLSFLFLVPSFAFAADDICTAIIEDLKDRKTAAQIVERVSGNSSINKTHVTDIHSLVVAATNDFNQRDTRQSYSNCSAEALNQLAQNVNNRNAPSRARTGAEDGAGNVAVALGMGAATMELGLTPQSAELREGTRGFASDPTLVHAPTRELESCTFLAETDYCTLPVGGWENAPISFDLMAGVAASLPTDVSHCQCIESKAKKEYPNDLERLRQMGERKKNLEDLIKKNFGTNFINKYAGHLEDVRFFARTARTAFTENTSQARDIIKGVQCSNSDDFKSAVRAKCQLPESELKAKMDSVFSILGQKADGFNYFDKLNREIMVNTSVPGKHMSRHDFDMVRSGMVRSDKNVKFADSFVTELLKDNKAVEEITKDTKKTPYNAIIDFIVKEISTNKRRFFNKYIDSNIVGQEKLRELEREFQDIPKAVATLTGLLDFTSEVHPGFDNLMKDSSLFASMANKMGRRDSSAIAMLENRQDLMLPKFRERCEEMKADLAQYLCTKEDELVNNVDKNELRQLVKQSGDDSNYLMDDLAICRNGGTQKNNGAFSRLTPGPEDRKSDVVERLTNKDYQTHKNLFTRIVKSHLESSSATRAYIAQAAQEGYSVSGNFDDSFGRQFDISSSDKISFAGVGPETQISQLTGVNPEVALLKDEARQAATAQTQLAQDVPPLMNPAYATNFMAPPPPQETSVAKSTSSSQPTTDMRSELREFLSNKENQENVDRLMRTADDKQVAELAKLREEALKNQERILQLQSESERMKLQQIKDQLATLEEKRAQAVSSNISPETDTESSDDRSQGRATRDIASVQGEVQGGANAGFTGQKAGGSAAGASAASNGSSDGGATLRSLRNELASGNGELSSAGSTEPVVISSAQARAGSIEIRSNELSSEILNFLESEPDVQTLIKIRKSGMLYKYKVVENGREVQKELMIDFTTLNDDVKKIIDQKIAESGRAGTEAQRLSADIRNLRRSHTFNSLKIILGEQLRR